MKPKLKKLLICLAIPLAVGGLSALLSGGMGDYTNFVQPPLSPPGWLFPVVWTVLYLLMGWASWLVWKSGAPWQQKRRALIFYGAQLAVNFLWSPIFFNAQAYGFAFLWLLLLWVLVLLMILQFRKADKTAALLQIPYLIWLTFAAYLNWGVFRLNP